jgi:MFS family permease
MLRVRLEGLWWPRTHPPGGGRRPPSVVDPHTALLLAAILVLDATPIEVAVLAAERMLPSLAFGLVAGVWVDRLRRRPVMIAADIGRVALLCSVPLAHAFDALRIEHLYAVAFTTGVLTLFFDVAYQSYLPSLVTKDELMEGNSKLQASESVSEFAGFSIAGWLTQIFSAPMALLIDAGTFVASAASIASIRTPEPPPPPAAERASAEALDGLRAVAHDRVLRRSPCGAVHLDGASSGHPCSS